MEKFFIMSRQPPVSLGIFCEVPRSHSDTPYSVGLLWTRDRTVEVTSTCTIHNTHKTQTSMPAWAGFEPAIPASERPQTNALDRAATACDGELNACLISEAVIKWQIKLSRCMPWRYKGWNMLQLHPFFKPDTISRSVVTFNSQPFWSRKKSPTHDIYMFLERE